VDVSRWLRLRVWWLERKATMRLWLIAHLPDPLLARPFEFFVAFLCVLSGATSLFEVSESEAVASTLEPWVSRAWSAALLLGGTALMAGLISIRMTATGMHVVTRVPAYRLGLRLLLVASLVYAGSLLHYIGPTFEVVPLIAFAGMCGIRLVTLGGRR
jgi:hypothetical protein